MNAGRASPRVSRRARWRPSSGQGSPLFRESSQAAAFPIPTTLSGSSITLNGIAAPILGVAAVNGQEQINFQVPYELAGASRAMLVVSANGQSSTPVEVPIVNAQPEIFVVTRDGSNLTLWATGLGPVSNAPATGQPAPSSPVATSITTPTVTVGGANANVSFSGLAPGFAGLYQVNATVPAGINSGAPIVIAIGAAASKPVALP